MRKKWQVLKSPLYCMFLMLVKWQVLKRPLYCMFLMLVEVLCRSNFIHVVGFRVK
jgi:hypothetical protein